MSRTKSNIVNGPQYWRSVEEFAQTKQFQSWLENEFPAGAMEWEDEVSRRYFLKLATASLALAGLNGCTKQPVETILPYVRQPEEIVPGEPLYYATAFCLSGYATGVLVKSREGHPIKIDGNPEHPASLGASNVWMQAAIRDLYDPDRSHAVRHNGEISSWPSFLSDLNQVLLEHSEKKGEGLRFLTETVTSPTLAAQLRALLKAFPSARWHQYEPINFDNVHEGARLAFNEIVATHYRFDKAAIILSLDSDFLSRHPMRLRYAREFIKGRNVAAGTEKMNRLYMAEPTPTLTGSMADNRLVTNASGMEPLARFVAQQITPETQQALDLDNFSKEWISAVARELKAHPSESIVIAGEQQPPIVHALVHLMNGSLGNVGKTVFYTNSAEAVPLNQTQSLRELINDIKSGLVDTLFILGGNPVYSAPADFTFREHLPKVKRSVHLGEYFDETSEVCGWHIPKAHWMETWSDARAFDGTVSILQPLIAPLYGGKSIHELLGAMLQQQPIPSDYEVVRKYWREQNHWENFEKGWRKALHDGVVQNTSFPNRTVQLKADSLRDIPRATGRSTPNAGIEVEFRPDPHLWDGRFANNAWLQELPKPLDKVCWDNVVRIGPELAQRLRITTGDVIELQLEGRTVRGPASVMPGQSEQTVTLTLGYGRTRAGLAGNHVGFNAYPLRASNVLWSANGVQIHLAGRRYQVVTTQNQHLIPNSERQIYRGGTFSEFVANANFVREGSDHPPKEQTLYNQGEFVYGSYRWGMSINLTACIGCNACVIGCQAENNIPVVGKDQIARGRDMFWIRVDTYHKGELANPGFVHIPVPCMQCENAPCEVVCPVAATLHDGEGLNLQVYNRCVGTRYCSNNCPYKVRRFNFFHYSKEEGRKFAPMLNPEVTVRWRGVMEKCTYCIQRISQSRIKSKEENRRIRDGEVVTACQQACPTEAIIFGDLNDSESRVSKLKKHPLDYSMLGQLNTRPRTTYLAEIENPNPELKT